MPSIASKTSRTCSLSCFSLRIAKNLSTHHTGASFALAQCHSALRPSRTFLLFHSNQLATTGSLATNADAKMAKLKTTVPELTMNDGYKIPQLAFGVGTALSKKSDDGKIDHNLVGAPFQRIRG